MSQCDVVLSQRHKHHTHKDGTVNRKKRPQVVDQRSAARVAELKTFFREELMVMHVILTAAFQTWFMLSQHPSSVALVLIRSARRCLLFGTMHRWHRRVQWQSAVRVAARLEAQINEVNQKADTELAKLESRYLKLKNDTLFKSLRRTFLSKTTTLTNFAFKGWLEITTEEKQNDQLVAKFLLNHKASAWFGAVRVPDLFRRWHRETSNVKRITELKEFLTNYVFVLCNTQDCFASSSAFKAWAFEVERESRVRRASCSTSAHARQDELIEAQARHQEVTDRRMRKAVMVLTTRNSDGLLTNGFHLWQQAAQLAMYEGRLHRLQTRHKKELDGLGRMRRLNPHTGPVAVAMAKLDASLLRIVYLAWRRQECFAHERAKMFEAMDAQQRVSCDMQVTEAKIQEDSMKRACEVMAKFVKLQRSVAQHDALERWRLGTKRAEITFFREHARRNEALCVDLLKEVPVMQVHLKRQCASALVGFGLVINMHVMSSGYLLFWTWEFAVRNARRKKDHERRQAEVDAMIEQIIELQGAWKSKRRDAATNASTALSFGAFLTSVLSAWKQQARETGNQKELQGMQAEISSVSTHIEQLTNSKRSSMKTPLTAWIDEQFGSKSTDSMTSSLIFREWQTVVVKEATARKQHLERKATQEDSLALLLFVVDHANRSLMAIVWLAFWQEQAMQVAEREKAEHDAAVGHLPIVDGRMAKFVSIHVPFVGSCTDFNVVWRVFREWRSLAGIMVVERTCDQVCNGLDEHEEKGQRAFDKHKETLNAAMGLALRSGDSSSHCPWTTLQLLLPAWNQLALLAARRRRALANEEQWMQHIEAVSARASAWLLRWAHWLSDTQLVAYDVHAISELLCAWLLVTRIAHRRRADVIAGATALGCAEVGLALGSLKVMRQRAFTAWQRLTREETLNRMEAQARTLEETAKEMGLEIELDMLSEPSISSSSEDEEEEIERSPASFVDSSTNRSRWPVQNEHGQRPWLNPNRGGVDSSSSHLGDMTSDTSAYARSLRIRSPVMAQPPTSWDWQTAATCVCGITFPSDAIFCRNCGEKRPEARTSSPKQVLQSPSYSSSPALAALLGVPSRASRSPSPAAPFPPQRMSPPPRARSPPDQQEPDSPLTFRPQAEERQAWTSSLTQVLRSPSYLSQATASPSLAARSPPQCMSPPAVKTRSLQTTLRPQVVQIATPELLPLQRADAVGAKTSTLLPFARAQRQSDIADTSASDFAQKLSKFRFNLDDPF